MQNYALTSPKPQTYIEKDPIGPSKRLRAPRSAVACRLFSLLQKQCHYIISIQTYIEKAPICSKTDFGPAEAVGRSQTRPVEDFGTDGGFYSNYPLYLGDVGHVSGTTSLRSPSCALRSV